MATATLSSATIDLKIKDTYPIRLGPSITRPKEAKSFSSVRYNHIPKSKSSKSLQCSIRPSKNSKHEELVLEDGSDEYVYAGKNLGNKDKYVLLCRKNGDTTELVLERVSSVREFNLTKTPSEENANKLANRYPQLKAEEETKDDLSGGHEDVEEPADPSNPWDYRNYLKPSTTKAKEQHHPVQDSRPATPQVQSRAANSTPVSRPVKQSSGPLVNQKKRKAPEPSKANPKRVKAGSDSPAPAAPTTATSKPKAALPNVKIEHKRLTQRRASINRSDELIMELDTPVAEKPPPRSMALALSGGLDGGLHRGPISLHSAASSPSSRVGSPQLLRPEGFESGDEFDLGGSSSPEVPSRPQSKQQNGDYFSNDAEDDADADVEDFELPSPAEKHGRRKSVATGTAIVDDDEDDLEQQMMAAMADDDDDGATASAPPAQVEEESEEE